MTSPRVDALLDAAEAEFAEAGFQTGSLRRIMRSAGADSGAVHYHFGGRKELATAVLDRVLVPLNVHRLELLDRAVAHGGPTLAELVEALIRPDIEAANALRARSPGRSRLIGAIYLRPADFVESTVAAHFAPVAEAFRPHLEDALPHLSFPVIAWRIRWSLFGTVGALLAHETAAFDLDTEDLVAELVRTLSAALAA
ncbi:MAG: TetR family transcriptional regulator [Acidimicrobiia bacterium]|nr:TetR family transcriptional regulator [Acidimicrobiia bacterium]